MWWALEMESSQWAAVSKLLEARKCAEVLLRSEFDDKKHLLQNLIYRLKMQGG